MRAVILHGGATDDAAGTAIHGMVCDALRAQGWEVETQALDGMRVKPCVGCFTCWLKTPGECAINDDGRETAKAIAGCDALIVLSSVTFGGYASRLKFALDRIIPTISPLFEWVKGEMHHKLRYPAHSFFAIGWQHAADADGAAVFTELAARNALNMHSPSAGSAVLHAEQATEEQRAQVTRLIAKLEVTQ